MSVGKKNFRGDSGGIQTHDLLLTRADVLTSRPPSLPDDDRPARIQYSSGLRDWFHEPIHYAWQAIEYIMILFHNNVNQLISLALWWASSWTESKSNQAQRVCPNWRVYKDRPWVIFIRKQFASGLWESSKPRATQWLNCVSKSAAQHPSPYAYPVGVILFFSRMNGTNFYEISIFINMLSFNKMFFFKNFFFKTCPRSSWKTITHPALVFLLPRLIIGIQCPRQSGHLIGWNVIMGVCIKSQYRPGNFAQHFKTEYQPKYINFTCKFGWYPRKSAMQIFLVSNFLCLAALWNWTLGPIS